MRIRMMAVAVAVGLAAGTLATGAPAPAQAASTTPILFGQIDHWKPNIVTDDNQLRIQSGIVGLFTKWAADQAQRDTVVRWFQWVRDRGGAPMLDIVPPTYVTLGNIATGKQDAHLRAWANSMRSWRHPILLRLLPEMNIRSHSYAPGTRGQTAAQFRSAWRHVVNLFRSRGATNVKWVWNPYRYYNGETSYKALWPGGSYVDWAALDGYNYHDATHPFRWPYALFSESVSRIRGFAPSKPLFVAEIGTRQESQKADWIRSVPTAMRRLGVKAVVWFNEKEAQNWRLDSSSASLTTARTVVHGTDLTYAGPWSMARIDQLVTTGR
jgi:Glycosyl hydrolase family 26